MLGHIFHVAIMPGRFHTPIQGRLLAKIVPTHTKAVAVGWFCSHIRLEALHDDAMLGFKQQVVEQKRSSVVSHPTTHAVVVPLDATSKAELRRFVPSCCDWERDVTVVTLTAPFCILVKSTL
jgi:hypothetical protein